jgi:NADH-quinone oxidoreductase subunit G
VATIFIDDRPYTVPDGKNLLEACLTLGFDLPYFCWHPAMHSVGACRQCAVKLYRDEKDRTGRIVMSCMTPAAEGTRISVDDAEARAFRSSVTEWLMANHPHDCPVCDEGGECHLQDMTVMTGHVWRRYRFPKRTHVNQDLGPFVNHEMNRCIQCYRCVRFYRDYAGGRDFDVFSCHANVYFGRHADGPLESEFAGNLVEVCPTGVFTDKTLKKHYTRKWDLQTAPSVCVHCGVGCNTIAGERYGTLRRIRNRFNGEVNGYFLCDRGRFGYEFVNGASRFRQPMMRKEGPGVDGAAERISAEKAIALLSPFLLPGGSAAVIGIGSPRASLEANFTLRTLVGPDHFYSGLGETEHRLIALIIDTLMKGPARTPSLKEVERADAVFVLGEDVPNTAPRIALALRQSVRQAPMAIARRLHIPPWDDASVREALQEKRGFLFVAGTAQSRLDVIATAACRAAPDDLARLGFAVAHILSETAPPVPGLSAEMEARARNIAGALRDAERPLVISGTALSSEAVIRAAAQVARALCELGKEALLCFITPECNSLGSGLLGGRPLEEAVDALEKGEAQTVLVVENDLYRRAEAPLVDRLLGAARHVIVIDHTESATTARADAVLPAATFAEQSGTLVSLEGRAQRYFSVLPPSGDIRESWRWLVDIIGATGRHRQTPVGHPASPAWRNLDDVTAAMIDAIPALRILRYVAPTADFRMTGGKIPRQPHRYSGRTAMTAHRDVREPKPPDDPDSPLAFSMEGSEVTPPPALLPRFWAPGWNSVQSVNKFQNEVGGALRGDDPGLRLLAPDGMDEQAYSRDIPPAFESREGQWLAVPLYHVFGSEELSGLAPGVAALSPQPYAAVNPGDNEKNVFGEGQTACIGLRDRELQLPLKYDHSLPPGVAGLPAGLRGLEGITLPAWGSIRLPGKEEKE